MASLKSAIAEQGMRELLVQLAKSVPDLTDQYSTFKIDTEYLQLKVRAQHAFQIKITLKALEIIANQKQENKDTFTVVDIGDSSGTHLRYLKSLISNSASFCSVRNFQFLSVNLDPIAVEKIRSKGQDAILCRAEELFLKNEIKANLFLSYEVLEHLSNPIDFLNKLSLSVEDTLFVLTVPYLSQSRVGLHHVRHNQKRDVYPENTHIFELSPTDWKLIFLHSGWEVIEETIYRQYPLKSWMRIMKPFWGKYDFEGFYGVILKKNRRWAELYQFS
jgi:hypothetical protein